MKRRWVREVAGITLGLLLALLGIRLIGGVLTMVLALVVLLVGQYIARRRVVTDDPSPK